MTKKDKFEKLIEEEIELDNYDDDNQDEEFDLIGEIKTLKILTIISVIIAIVSLLLSLIILNKFSSTTIDNSDSSNPGDNVEYDVSMFTEVSVDKFVEMYENNNNYFVFTGRGTCGYCVAFLPVLQESISEYDYTLYYLDVDKLTNSDLTRIANLNDGYKETIGATPMVYYMGKNKVIDIHEGYSEYKAYVEFLEDNGVVKKNK